MPLTITAESFIAYVWQGSEYAVVLEIRFWVFFMVFRELQWWRIQSFLEQTGTYIEPMKAPSWLAPIGKFSKFAPADTLKMHSLAPLCSWISL